MLFLRDSTIQRNLQRVVSEREALSAFGHIAAGVAHEVKNPLGGIRGAAEILASRAHDAKAVDAAELIVREVDRIASLVDDLMVFSHGEDLRLAPLNIHRILDDVLDLLVLDPLGRGVVREASLRPLDPRGVDRCRPHDPGLPEPGTQRPPGHGGRCLPGTLAITTRTQLDRRLTAADGRQLPVLLVEIADTGPGITERPAGEARHALLHHPPRRHRASDSPCRDTG